MTKLQACAVFRMSNLKNMQGHAKIKVLVFLTRTAKVEGGSEAGFSHLA